MKVSLQLRYSTKFGQSFSVVGNHPVLGGNDITKPLPLEYVNEERWQASFEIPTGDLAANPVSYKLLLREDDGTRTLEWGDDKKIVSPSAGINELVLIDSWNYAGFYENTFYTEPFRNVFFKNNQLTQEVAVPEVFTHIFKVKAPLLKPNQALCLCGNVPELGGWSADNLQLLSKKADEDWWTIHVNLANATLPLAYKYGVYNLSDKSLLELEGGNNRVLHDQPATDKQTIVTDCFIHLPNNTFRAAGIAIPVFALRSENSLGVGEFNDIKLLVDWAKKTGLKLVQLLPVNDTIATFSYYDSYPYAAISAFALHPQYLNIASIINKKEQAFLNSITELSARLNASSTVDYVEVTTAKFELIRKIFAGQKKATFKEPGFISFFESNAHWLVPYAAFSYLRDQNKSVEYNNWPQHSKYDAAAIHELAGNPARAKDEIAIYYFIQYHLHLQLKSATEYAHANGIIVKGDIPIGIYRNSVDAWQEPELYNMDMQAGAPPDDFAVKGQNWGFPTYNWNRMAQDGFTWWKRRFAQMSYYFDAFRIDHILGFFRIWSIPMDAVEGILGHFVPALPVPASEFNLNDADAFQRYTTPFINDYVLNEVFGGAKQQVTEQYLEPMGEGLYRLLPSFDTQRKIEDHFGSLEQHEENQRVKIGLFDLVSNVILFEDKDSNGTQFHFRISMENTTSFKALPWEQQNKLRELYVNYFYVQQDQFWKHEALAKLPEIKRGTNMLICGEDLGMVPSTVPGVMRDLGILSLEIQRMPKDPNREFFHPDDAPYLSVVTPSTHDMSTIRGWWEEDKNVIQRFYNRELGQYGKAPAECEPWINKTILLQHFYSPAMWSIFQLQDLLGMSETLRRPDPNEERINIPANPKHYWRYRMHITLEDLVNEEEYNKQLLEIVVASGR
ncbi:4-alpha-glucanotransferase [Segetibacter sp. 3557_3]|nr:4-alpha-glucanotransferase [Segetibacter sp. 3557_3]